MEVVSDAASSSENLVDVGPDLIRSYRPQKVFHLDGGRVTSLDWVGKYCVAAVSRDGVRLIDCEKGIEVEKIEDKKSVINLVRFTHHSKALLLSNKDASNVRTIDYVTIFDNKVLCKFYGHQGRIVSLSMNPNNDLFCSSDVIGSVMVWDVREKANILNLSSRFGKVKSTPYACWHPNGIEFAVVTESNNMNTVRMHDIRKSNTFTKMCEIPSGKNQPFVCTDMSFSRDGSKLVVSSDENFYLVQNDNRWDFLPFPVKLSGAGEQGVAQCDLVQKIPRQQLPNQDSESEKEFFSEIAGFDPTGRYFIAPNQCRIDFFDTTLPSTTAMETTLEEYAHPSPVENVRWSPTTEAFVSTSINCLVFWAGEK